MTFTRRSHLADLTTDPPSVRGLHNGYSLFTQYFEDRWYVLLINRDRDV